MMQPTADMRCDHQTKISKKFPLGWVADILLVCRFIRQLINKQLNICSRHVPYGQSIHNDLGVLQISSHQN